MKPKYVSSVAKKPLRELVLDSKSDTPHYELIKGAGERKTGFDILLETKKANIKILQEMMKDPNFIRADAVKRLGITKRTVTRLLAEIRKTTNAGRLFRTAADIQLEEKQKRLKLLKQLVISHPELYRVQMAKKLGVSTRTLYDYLDELETV